jgi:hypothetical protein
MVITKALAHTGFRVLDDDAFFKDVSCMCIFRRHEVDPSPRSRSRSTRARPSSREENMRHLLP